ncbi:MAG: M23 family metallopeptidase, partial [Pseudomonadota bacterium]
MTRTISMTALSAATFCLLGCQALAQPPVPSLSPSKVDSLEETRAALAAGNDIDVVVESADEDNEGEDIAVRLDGTFSQGGLVTGHTQVAAIVKLDGNDVDVDEDGNFIIGFGRDHGPTAILSVEGENGQRDEIPLDIESRKWKESRITVTDSNKVNPYKEEDLAKIRADSAKKKQARRNRSTLSYWTKGFAWPADGCISSPFGYRRFVNGEPRRYHSGVDVAAPDGMSPMDYIGADVRAPADGYVRLAEDDMFFEGGLIFIDHGQKLETAVMHLSRVDVQAGDFVEQGQVIGAIGMTGRVTGPHLHW